MVLQQIGKIHDHQYQVLLCTFIRNLSYVPQNVLHAPDYFRILWIFRGHSPECLATFLGMFGTFPLFPAFRSPFLYSWFYSRCFNFVIPTSSILKFDNRCLFKNNLQFRYLFIYFEINIV